MSAHPISEIRDAWDIYKKFYQIVSSRPQEKTPYQYKPFSKQADGPSNDRSTSTYFPFNPPLTASPKFTTNSPFIYKNNAMTLTPASLTTGSPQRLTKHGNSPTTDDLASGGGMKRGAGSQGYRTPVSAFFQGNFGSPLRFGALSGCEFKKEGGGGEDVGELDFSHEWPSTVLLQPPSSSNPSQQQKALPSPYTHFSSNSSNQTLSPPKSHLILNIDSDYCQYSRRQSIVGEIQSTATSPYQNSMIASASQLELMASNPPLQLRKLGRASMRTSVMLSPLILPNNNAANSYASSGLSRGCRGFIDSEVNPQKEGGIGEDVLKNCVDQEKEEKITASTSPG